jgi:hypothetical protein
VETGDRPSFFAPATSRGSAEGSLVPPSPQGRFQSIPVRTLKGTKATPACFRAGTVGGPSHTLKGHPAVRYGRRQLSADRAGKLS